MVVKSMIMMFSVWKKKFIFQLKRGMKIDIDIYSWLFNFCWIKFYEMFKKGWIVFLSSAKISLFSSKKHSFQLNRSSSILPHTLTSTILISRIFPKKWNDNFFINHHYFNSKVSLDPIIPFPSLFQVEKGRHIYRQKQYRKESPLLPLTIVPGR